MKFLAADIGEVVVRELCKAVEARVAVAFFNPDDRLLAALNAVPKPAIREEFPPGRHSESEFQKSDGRRLPHFVRLHRG